jgi:ABC-2 type transport system ATP-binding protein
MEPVITAAGLTKRYGDTTVVNGISLDVRRGEIFGIVGPNGAGKTTTVEMMQGLRPHDGGSVTVLGLDPRRDAAELRQRVGTQLQSAVLPERMKVWEALDLYATFYRTPQDPKALLRNWDLADKRDAAFETLSGGQRQRLFIALALIGSPELVFLDELTTGLDPQARRATWDLIRAVRATGVTVVLITHFMDEAETLCDRVAVIDQGGVIALDTPAALVDDGGEQQRVRFTAPPDFDLDMLDGIEGATGTELTGDVVVVTGTGPLLARVATALAAHQITPTDLTVERTNLEDAFLALTGRTVRS